jgi:hypothetical protein
VSVQAGPGRRFALAEAAGSSDGWTDARILMQLGMLLGLAYVGFLTVWFWATRVRPHGYNA